LAQWPNDSNRARCGILDRGSLIDVKLIHQTWTGSPTSYLVVGTAQQGSGMRRSNMKIIGSTMGLALLLTFPSAAFALAFEVVGNAPMARQGQWAPGVVDIVNLKTRVYAYLGDGQHIFYFRGDAAAVNEALRLYGSVRDDERKLILLPGSGKTKSFGQEPIPFACQLQVPGSLRSKAHATVMTVYISGFKPRPVEAKPVEKWLGDLNSEMFKTRDQASRELQKLGNDAKPFLSAALKPGSTLEARRRIEILLQKLSDLDVTDLEIPKGLTVVRIKEQVDKGLEALKSADRNVRAFAVWDLSPLAPYSERVVPALADVVKNDQDKDNRRIAAERLAIAAVHAKSAVAVLKKGLEDSDKTVRDACHNTLEVIDRVQVTPEQEEQTRRERAIAKEIDEFDEFKEGGDGAPKTPLECRQRVLAEIERFRKMKGPDDLGGGDEHIGRATLWHFHELMDETTLILALAGDKDAVAALVKQYGLENPSLQRWIDDRHVRYFGSPSWSREMYLVAEIMDTHRPELARKMRDEMRRLATSKENEPRPNFERMPLKELKQAALAGEQEAMIRWALVDPEAVPALVQRMNDKERSDHEQFLAAQALAIAGDDRGLTWLRQRAARPQASAAGAGLLRAGGAGQKIFFELVKDFEEKKEKLPTALSETPLLLDTELYCKLLPQLAQIKDAKLRYNLDHALMLHRLPAATLSYLIDQVRKDDRKESFLIEDLRRSISFNGTEDRLARDVARLWAEELLNAEDTGKWECGANLFLAVGLGNTDLAAASARRQLKKSAELAAQVLAEAGRADDTPLIWAAAHLPVDTYTQNWYEGPSRGWLATVRLTNHLVMPK
jgi:hypothetical protein